jgi:hypothetical protein
VQEDLVALFGEKFGGALADAVCRAGDEDARHTWYVVSGIHSEVSYVNVMMFVDASIVSMTLIS